MSKAIMLPNVNNHNVSDHYWLAIITAVCSTAELLNNMTQMVPVASRQCCLQTRQFETKIVTHAASPVSVSAKPKQQSVDSTGLGHLADKMPMVDTASWNLEICSDGYLSVQRCTIDMVRYETYVTIGEGMRAVCAA